MENKTLFAYLAGLIDGEGTISILRRGKYSFKPHMEIQVSTGDALYKLKDNLANENIDLHVYIHPIDQRKANYKRMYSAQFLSFDMMETVLEKTLPFYLIKQEQAKILLALVKKRKALLKQNRHAPYDAEDSKTCKKIQSLNGNLNNGRRGTSAI